MIRDWLVCLAMVRALGRQGRRDAGDLWRIASRWERKMIVAHLQSQADATLTYVRIERRAQQRKETRL